MYRDAMTALYEWKQQDTRKPLIVEGARQVGKTWLMREFGKDAYEHVVYLNFDSNRQLGSVFSGDLEPDQLVNALELLVGHTINPATTLLIFDEVQEVPRALTSLKYFSENAPQYHILCAGSLLGIALHPGTSFPVGKVDFLKLNPMTFSEYLRATGNERFADLLKTGDYQMMTVFKDTYLDALKRYFYVGGMPAAVRCYAETGDAVAVRRIQRNILQTYDNDFSKHAPNALVPRIRTVWNSIPSQLAKENRKFVYGVLREGARAREYEEAIMWLTDCGLVRKVPRVTSGCEPLSAYEDLKAFKLFSVDVGLLACLSGLKRTALLNGDSMFTEFRGALTEQYACQELAALTDTRLYYYTNDRGSAEVDFVLSTEDCSMPVEVKSSINLRARSLKVYREKYRPPVAVRVSTADYKVGDGLIDLPLYAIENIAREASAVALPDKPAEDGEKVEATE